MLDPKAKDNFLPEHYEAVGRVIVVCSSLEKLLTITAFSLIMESSRPWEDDIAVGVLTTGMTATSALGAVRTLVGIRFPDDAKKFGKFADRVSTTFSHRDLFAHCIWEDGNKPGTVVPMMAKTIGSLRITQRQELTDRPHEFLPPP